MRFRPKLRGCSRKVWVHRAASVFFVLLAIPAVLWWQESILFVILLSLATQASTEWGVAEAADDQQLAERLDRIEKLLSVRD